MDERKLGAAFIEAALSKERTRGRLAKLVEESTMEELCVLAYWQTLPGRRLTEFPEFALPTDATTVKILLPMVKEAIWAEMFERGKELANGRTSMASAQTR